MCEQDRVLLQQIQDTLQQIERLSLSTAYRPPENVTVTLSGTKPYVVDYRDFRYLYVFCSSSIVLSAEDVGLIFVGANTWTDISLPPSIRLFRQDSTSSVTMLVRATDRPYTTASLSGPFVGPAVAAFSGNPSQTASASADTLFQWGTNGTQQVNHLVLQNNSGISFLYAFDQDSTASTSQIYTLSTGSTIFWDRALTTLHSNSASQKSFGTSTGITIEAFV